MPTFGYIQPGRIIAHNVSVIEAEHLPSGVVPGEWEGSFVLHREWTMPNCDGSFTTRHYEYLFLLPSAVPAWEARQAAEKGKQAAFIERLGARRARVNALEAELRAAEAELRAAEALSYDKYWWLRPEHMPADGAAAAAVADEARAKIRRLEADIKASW
jgi:hypothetical protein